MLACGRAAREFHAFPKGNAPQSISIILVYNAWLGCCRPMPFVSFHWIPVVGWTAGPGHRRRQARLCQAEQLGSLGDQNSRVRMGHGGCSQFIGSPALVDVEGRGAATAPPRGPAGVTKARSYTVTILARPCCALCLCWCSADLLASCGWRRTTTQLSDLTAKKVISPL